MPERVTEMQEQHAMQEGIEESFLRVCRDCQTFKFCKKCDKAFCPHFASRIDFLFCENCFKDLILEDSIIRKTTTSTSLNGKKTFTRVQRARLLVFKGEDWMFAQRRITELSDEEFAITLEYHRAILGEMLNEYEARRIANNRKKFEKLVAGASGASMVIPTRTGTNTDGTPITVTETTVKRTKVSSIGPNKDVHAALAGVVAMFKAQGLTEEQIKNKILALAGANK